MKSHSAYLTFHTKALKDIIPITNDVEPIIRESEVREGLALVSAMHLTASVIIQDEESGPQAWESAIIPRSEGF